MSMSVKEALECFKPREDFDGDYKDAAVEIMYFIEENCSRELLDEMPHALFGPRSFYEWLYSQE